MVKPTNPRVFPTARRNMSGPFISSINSIRLSVPLTVAGFTYRCTQMYTELVLPITVCVIGCETEIESLIGYIFRRLTSLPLAAILARSKMAAPWNSMSNSGPEQKARLPCNPTSFQKKSRSNFISIPGTRPSVQNGQLIVSTGVTSLDYVIGGGLAVGTLLLIEEDKYDSYSRMLVKYFLAEGVVCGHSLFIASARDHPDEVLQELPAPILDDIASPRIEEGQGKLCDPEGQDSMKIAWRYQNLPKVQTALASSSRFGHYYDVSKAMDTEMRQAAKCTSFFLPDELTLSSATGPSQMNEGYRALLRSIQGVIRNQGFDGSTPQKSRNVLRIALPSLGSALWGDDICCTESPGHAASLTTFLYGLRALLRSSLSVAMVTMPAHLIQNRAIMDRVTKLCDTAIALESFRGLEREANPLYKDYHGLLHVKQIPHLNCLVCEVPDTKDLAFKLKRKQFTIERLHLPPDLSDTVSRLSKPDLAESAKLLSSGCGSTAAGKKHLDF